jgi:ATP-dependent Zn protease
MIRIFNKNIPVIPFVVGAVGLAAGYKMAVNGEFLEPLKPEPVNYSQLLKIRNEKKISYVSVDTKGIAHLTTSDGQTYETVLPGHIKPETLFNLDITALEFKGAPSWVESYGPALNFWLFFGTLFYALSWLQKPIDNRTAPRETPESIRKTAYHEAGHALLTVLCPNFYAPDYVTIIPTKGTFGHLAHGARLRRNYHREAYLNYITMVMGGAAAEQIAYDRHEDGCVADLKRAMRIATYMVSKVGMSDNTGMVSYDVIQPYLQEGVTQFLKSLFLKETVSGETLREIELEARILLKECMERARKIISENRAALEALTEALLLKKTLQGEQIRDIVARHKADAQPCLPFETGVPAPEPVPGL